MVKGLVRPFAAVTLALMLAAPLAPAAALGRAAGPAPGVPTGPGVRAAAAAGMARPAAVTPGFNWVDGVENTNATFLTVTQSIGWDSSYVGYYPYTDSGGYPTGDYPQVGDTYYMHVVTAVVGNPWGGGEFSYMDVQLPDSTQLAIDSSHPLQCFLINGLDTTKVYNVSSESSCTTSGPRYLDVTIGSYAIPSYYIYEVQFPVRSTAYLNGISKPSSYLISHNEYAIGTFPSGAEQYAYMPIWVPNAYVDTTITAKPALSTTSTSASFSFTSNVAGAGFECRLDSGQWTACTSPKAYTGLSRASHTFRVAAIDGFDRADPTPASYTWTITSTLGPPAKLAVSGLTSPRAPASAGSITVRATDASGTTTPSYRGTVHFGSSDPFAKLPADYTFTAADAGVHSFSVTLNSGGTQSVTATDRATASIAGSETGIVVAYPAGSYHPLTPARLLDSRPTASGHTNIGLTGKFSSGAVRTFKVAGVKGLGQSVVSVPATAIAVTGNLTIVGETASGVVALGPVMGSTGATTTISVTSGDIRANNVTLALGAGGTLSAVYRATAGASADLIFDVTGYFSPDTAGARYTPLAPGRVLDSRPTGSGHTNIGLAGTFKTGIVRTFGVAGVKGLGWAAALVPATATGVTGNLTVTNASSDGFVAIGPMMSSTPSTSTLNTKKGSNRANGVTVALHNGTLGAVWKGTPGSTADVIFDVTGYFTQGSSGLLYHPITPVRALNSQAGVGLTGAFGSNVPRSLTLSPANQVPAGAKGLSGNLTILAPSSAGFAFIGPSPVAAKPASSTVNTTAGLAVANGFDVALNASGALGLVWAGTTGSTAHLALDVTGYWK